MYVRRRHDRAPKRWALSVEFVCAYSACLPRSTSGFPLLLSLLPCVSLPSLAGLRCTFFSCESDFCWSPHYFAFSFSRFSKLFIVCLFANPRLLCTLLVLLLREMWMHYCRAIIFGEGCGRMALLVFCFCPFLLLHRPLHRMARATCRRSVLLSTLHAPLLLIYHPSSVASCSPGTACFACSPSWLLFSFCSRSHLAPSGQFSVVRSHAPPHTHIPSPRFHYGPIHILQFCLGTLCSHCTSAFVDGYSNSPTIHII